MPRYIDAERLIQSIQFMSDMCSSDNIRFVCADIATLVEEQPTADVVERKKGKWIYHKGLSESRECSCCHVWFDWDMPRNSFCPNCGADMREEKTDE